MASVKCNTCQITREDSKKGLKKCGKCNKVRYCSKKCQIEDWKRHRFECYLTDKCAICLSKLGLKNFCQTNCGHRFHLTCLLPWSQQSNICPYCRGEIIDKII